MATLGLTLRREAVRVTLPRREALLFGVIAAGFFVAPNPVWALLFYALVLPMWGGALLLRRVALPTDAGTWAGVALIAWFTLTTAWDDSTPFVHALWLWNGLCTLVFFLSVRSVAGARAMEAERLVTLLLVCGLANAAVAFVRLAALGAMDGRMIGWAETRHPILGASVMGACVVLAAGRLLEGRTRGLAGAALAAGLVFIFMTGSRGPLIAIVGALALLLLAVRARLLVASAGLAATMLATLALAAPGLLGEASDRLMKRGWSSRLDIWDLAVREIGERPLFGHGPSARLHRATDNFPHDLFLSTLFYSGAVGLLLLLLLLALAARAAWRQPGPVARWTLLALIAHTVLSGLTDLSQITKGPSPIWYIVWLPLALALGPFATRADAPARAGRRADCLPE